MDLIESGQVSVDFMTTHHFPLDQTKEAFDLVAAYGDGCDVYSVLVNDKVGAVRDGHRGVKGHLES